jgi:hypothetical protein
MLTARQAEKEDILPDHYIEKLKQEIASLKGMLEPLVSGKMHVGERRGTGPWTDTTKARIDHLKSTVAMYQSIVSSANAHRT